VNSHVSTTLCNLRKNSYESVNVIERTLTEFAFTTVLKMQEQSGFIAKYCMPSACLESVQTGFLRSQLLVMLHCLFQEF